MLREAFEAWWAHEYPDITKAGSSLKERILLRRDSDEWPAFCAALRWADGQGWLQHAPGCESQVSPLGFGYGRHCTCGLDTLRKELAE